MIKINYKDSSVDFQAGEYETVLEKIKKEPMTDFEAAQPDLAMISDKADKYSKYKNVILIGNGGSRTSALAFYNSLYAFRNNVNFEFLSSAEPDLVNNIRSKYSSQDTLVMVISKSGDNINALEPLFFFSDYPTLVITGQQDNTLSEIAKQKNWEIIIHPEVGGRFSGLTSCGLVPAALMGLDIREIYEGAKRGYESYNYTSGLEINEAFKLAAYLYELEKAGYVEIFSSIYSMSLFGFFPLIVQLIHESSGKDGKGQTIFGDYSPESQHHTNQRFFGGRKNVAGLFIFQEKTLKDQAVKVPADLSSIKFKDKTLGILDGLLGSETMRFDMEGVAKNCAGKKIPAIKLSVDEINLINIGEYMVFWQYVSVYSAYLRNQNPFDQPEVEESKKISFELRLKR